MIQSKLYSCEYQNEQIRLAITISSRSRDVFSKDDHT